MKCAKCGYLGFETGERCRNCGFDFSLLAATAVVSEPKGPLDELPLAGPSATPDVPDWLARLHPEPAPGDASPAGSSADAPPPIPPTPVEFPTQARSGVPDRVAPAARGAGGRDGLSLDSPPSGGDADVVGALSMKTPAVPLPRGGAHGGVGRGTAARRRDTSALPLFEPPGDDPPPQLRAGPRPPLSVRRTPDSARVRALAREVASAAREEPALQLADPAELDALRTRDTVAGGPEETAGTSVSRRLLAAGLDAGLLGAVALVVVALTLRMLALPFGAWRALAFWPMGGFLGLLAFAYLWAFTAVGGQTVGKMIAGVRVVGLDGKSPGTGLAARRAAASLLSLAALGLGFLPLMARPVRLTLHDRLARTRVVDARYS